MNRPALRNSGLLLVLFPLLTGSALSTGSRADVVPEDAPTTAVASGEKSAVTSEFGREPTTAELKFFEQSVRPVLVANCFGCHGAEKSKGGLRLDQIGEALAGGESGEPAIVPGKPHESVLIDAINRESYEMPPAGKLKDQEIAALTKWVEMGAPWPGGHGGGATKPVRSAEKITDADRQWWAYQPVVDPAVPPLSTQLADWSENDIDAFIVRKLKENGLAPSAPADRRTLIRRVTFDLIGLPPTPAEIEAFVNDTSPDAYEQLVDRLLDSPQHGEHWARYWLDLVRYAESDGFRQDAYRPQAWRYRDYVVRSFNADKPYNQFVTEQLAGDEVAPDDPDARIATGYLRHWIYEYNQRDCRTQWEDILNDITDTTADVFLGMGMGCARCHDHKFDPILQKDYFRLRSYFGAVISRDDVPAATLQQRQRHDEQQAAWEQATADIRTALAKIIEPRKQYVARKAIEKFPPDVREFMFRDESTWTPKQRQLADLVNRQVLVEYVKIEDKLNKTEKPKYEELQQQLAKFDHLKPAPLPLAMTASDVGPAASPMTIPGKSRMGAIEPGVPTLFDPEPAVITPLPQSPNSTGRRAALAKWLTDPANPLTPRVIVNRIWQYHFGTGLVETPSDFGHLGTPPSHPELLDWLTSRFLEDGWRMKPLHRRIVLSATYRQQSVVEATDQALRVDPANRLLWRQSVRRLRAEQVRDAILAGSGELQTSQGGPSVSHASPKRTIYTKVMRNSPDPLVAAFDGPQGITSTAERNVTTTSTQALLLTNGKWVAGRAGALAKRLQTIPNTDERIAQAYQLCYGRDPAADELSAARSFLEYQQHEAKPDDAPNTDVLQFANMPGHESSALVVSQTAQDPLAHFQNTAELPTGDFTIEAVILLRSLYPDATVRTIVSQWDNNTANPGWAFGVTSAKSAYKPRNLILQLIGQTANGSHKYEVIASNLRPELNRPYYVSVSVRLSDTGKTGVTFVMKDLANPQAAIQTANVPHAVVKDYRTEVPLVIGGRARSTRHRWDGLLDNIRLSNAALPVEQLLINSDVPEAKNTVAHWQFDAQATRLTGIGPRQLQLISNRPGSSAASPKSTAWQDLCHVLLNSNELLYVD